MARLAVYAADEADSLLLFFLQNVQKKMLLMAFRGVPSLTINHLGAKAVGALCVYAAFPLAADAAVADEIAALLAQPPVRDFTAFSLDAELSDLDEFRVVCLDPDAAGRCQMVQVLDISGPGEMGIDTYFTSAIDTDHWLLVRRRDTLAPIPGRVCVIESGDANSTIVGVITAPAMSELESAIALQEEAAAAVATVFAEMASAAAGMISCAAYAMRGQSAAGNTVFDTITYREGLPTFRSVSVTYKLGELGALQLIPTDSWASTVPFEPGKEVAVTDAPRRSNRVVSLESATTNKKFGVAEVSEVPDTVEAHPEIQSDDKLGPVISFVMNAPEAGLFFLPTPELRADHPGNFLGIWIGAEQTILQVHDLGGGDVLVDLGNIRDTVVPSFQGKIRAGRLLVDVPLRGIVSFEFVPEVNGLFDRATGELLLQPNEAAMETAASEGRDVSPEILFGYIRTMQAQIRQAKRGN
jgi:hypothetical protein